jgi:hypothetical protein
MSAHVLRHSAGTVPVSQSKNEKEVTRKKQAGCFERKNSVNQSLQKNVNFHRSEMYEDVPFWTKTETESRLRIYFVVAAPWENPVPVPAFHRSSRPRGTFAFIRCESLRGYWSEVSISVIPFDSPILFIQ